MYKLIAYSCRAYNTSKFEFITIIKIEDLTKVLMFYRIYKTSWGKEIKCEACRAFYLFFATSLINSTKHEHEC